MSGNGHRKLDWLDQARVYAALAEAGNPQDARLLLAQEGLAPPLKVLADCDREGRHKVARLRESGLAPALLGPAARHFRRLQRLETLCSHLEDRIRREDPPLDRELAGLLQQYRELVALLWENDSERGANAGSGAAPEGVSTALSLLEALHHEELPPGDSDADLCDAARRLAAASGHTFSPPEPAQPTLAGDPDAL